ncbi:MAG: hypothetical protein EPO35_11970 [Acidobacteria bacterium]|nr:MAG: hypothetical protein EPO35_11970 [Acidobacteriota bacterium]
MARQFRNLTLGLVAVLAFGGAIISGQGGAATAADPFKSLHFRSIGPAQASGRVSDIAVYEANPSVFYVGSAHGGVWKTTNNGATFTPQFQNEGLISVGDLAVSQKNPDLVWLGTGESNNRQSTGWGGGVWKSTDGGKTWKNMGLAKSEHINRIVIDADNDNVVMVAATGPLFKGGGERGIYKTTDGGATWKLVLKGDNEFTGANDLVQSAADHKILYASTYQRQRAACCMNGGGPGSGIWKSVDGGDTWTRLTGNGLPAGNYGRIGLDVFRRSANLVYAEIQTEPAAGAGRGAQQAPAAAPATPSAEGIYRTDDGGATWRRVGNNPDGRAMYFSQVRVDPNNPDRVLVASVRLSLSTDGGRSFTAIDQQVHDDKHAIWWDPANSDHILIGGDGGAFQTWDMTRSWIWFPNLPIATFYHVGYDNEYPYNVCGGMQDNYDWCGPSAVRTIGGISNDRWHTVQGGDGFVAILDQRDSRIVYTESQDGNLTRRNRVTGQSKSIRPSAQNTTDTYGGGNYRFHWDTPLQFSAADSGTLLVGGNKIFKSTDRGDSWTALSPDLTTADNRDDQMIMGVRNTADSRMIARNDGVQSWPAITAMADSLKAPGLLMAGTDDGTVSISRDGGKTWDKKVADRLPGFVPGGFVAEIVLSRFDPNVIYIVSDAHRSGDLETHIWASKDQGATFASINANLKGEVVKTITEDQKNGDVLYIGTETGMFLSLNRGQAWQRLSGANFPTIRTDEITLHARDNAMIVATHGRGIWILDHLSPIQEFTAAQSGAADAKLFTPEPALQWRQWDDKNDEFWAHQYWLGENPPTDAVLNLYFKKALTDVKLKITDATGRQMRELTVPAAKAQPGIQTVCWDQRVDPLPSATGNVAPQFGGRGAAGAGRAGGGFVTTPGPLPGYMAEDPCGGGFANRGGGGFAGGATQGPLVMPGTYNVALVVDGKTIETKTLKIVADPTDQMNDVQRKRYFDMAMDLHNMQRQSGAMTTALQSLYSQLGDNKAKIDAGSADVKAAVAAFTKDFDAVRVKFGVPPAIPAAGGAGGGRGGGAPVDPANVGGKVAAAKGSVLAFTELPSGSTMKAYADVKLALPKAIAEGNAVIAKATALSTTLKKADVTLTVPAPVK